jgi:uncharacterized Fe-S cluster-containing radical SAM superfamily protein
MTERRINTAQMDAALRPRVFDDENRRVLISRIADSAQERDLSLSPNCQGLGRIRHFRRTGPPGWPDNPLPIRPASRWLGLRETAELRAQVFQLAACAWRCWYCYVPYSLLSADARRAEWKTAIELIDLYLAEPDRPRVLDLTGGSPDLAPEWTAWTMDAIEERGVGSNVYLWSDDNLSSDRLLRRENRQILERMIAHGRGYGKVCCLKGFDEASFAFNTGATELGFREQLRILRGYADTDLDLYLYVTLTSPPRADAADLVRRLVDVLGGIRLDLPSRTVPLFIAEFSVMKPRINSVTAKALAFQWDLMVAWTDATGSNLTGPSHAN